MYHVGHSVIVNCHTIVFVLIRYFLTQEIIQYIGDMYLLYIYL